jgi:methylated-DNA-[protein]-cysteine S-methyltransferase
VNKILAAQDAHDGDIHRLLGAASDGEAATLDGLRARLADDAERDGALDVAYVSLDTPVGWLLLAATDVGLVRVAFAVQDHDAVREELARRISPRVLRAPRRLDPAARQLDEYFERRRTRFALPIDLRFTSGFRRDVLDHLQDIAFGHTESYAQVAASVGRPKAVRAVGTACARNPVPIVVPCHRVVRSDGSFGDYAGGSDLKRALLELEMPG